MSIMHEDYTNNKNLEACKRAPVSLLILYDVSHYARFVLWR